VFEGPLEVLGSMVLPTLAILTLFAIPFVDRARVTKLTQRTVAVAVVTLAAVGWSGLTVAAILSTPKSSALAAGEIDVPGDWQRLSPEELAGIAYYRKANCASCHTMGEGGSKAGPDLPVSDSQRSAEWMIEHFKHPSQLVPGAATPASHLAASELNAL